MDIYRFMIASAQGLVEEKRRREQACHIEHDETADILLMAKYVHELSEAMFATNGTIQLEPGMVPMPVLETLKQAAKSREESD